MPPRQRDPKTMSHDPAQMRRRIRRKAGYADREIEHYLETVYEKPIDQWDWEELARGRPRSKRGDFSGYSAKWLTPLVVKEARRRLVEGIYGDLGTSAQFAVQTLQRLVSDGEVDDRVALEAAKYILDHILGKPKALVEIDASDNVRQFLANAIVLDDGRPQHQVIEGQYQSNDEEEDDDD
jgi:hypothetical protein